MTAAPGPSYQSLTLLAHPIRRRSCWRTPTVHCRSRVPNQQDRADFRARRIPEDVNVPESSQSTWKPLFWLVLATLIAVYLLYNYHSDQLQAQIDDEHQSLRSLSRNLAALNDEQAKTTEALNAAKTEISRLQDRHAEQMDSLKAEHRGATDAMQQAHEQRLVELSDRIEGFDSEKALLTAETEAWKRAKDKLEQDLRNAIEASATLEARLADTAETRRELEVKLAADDSTIAELNALLNRANQTEALLNDKLERGVAAQDELQELVKKEESAILELQDKLVATTQSRAALERLLATADRSSTGDQASGSESDASRAGSGPEQEAMQARIEALEADLEATAAERDQLARANAASQSDKDAEAAMAEMRQRVEAERAAFEDQIAQTNQRLAELQDELEAERKALEQALAEAKAQQEDGRAAALAEAEETMETLRQQLMEDKEAAIASLQKDHSEEMAQSLAEAEERNRRLTQALEAERETLAQQAAAYQQEQTELSTALDETESSLDELKQKLAGREDEQQSKSAADQARIAEAEAALDTMRRKLQEQEEALQSAREEGKRLRENLTEQVSGQVHDFYQRFASLEAEVTDRGLLINLSDEDIRFPSGSAVLPDNAGPTLSQVAEILTDHPGLRVQIEGHTDSSGSSGINLQLSEQRAAAVRDALIKRGVKAGRLSIQGLGAEQPIADNATDAGRQRNRRVELYVAREGNS